MALAKYRLKGHESFILREGWITKALFAIDRDPLLFTVSAGADALGVGTNMAKSIRYWMRTAGLTDESQATGVHLTELGRTILQCDPYLEDIFTLWIIHINIATNYKLATSWNAGITCQTPAKKRVTSTEANEVVKDVGKTDRKPAQQKQAVDGKDKKLSIHERLEINKRIIQEKQGKDKTERGVDLGVRTV